MQIPGGMLADRFLPRLVIAGATIGWGAFAALAAASTGWITMLLTRLEDPAGNLSGGQQQMLAIARGLMSKPKISLALSMVLLHV